MFTSRILRNHQEIYTGIDFSDIEKSSNQISIFDDIQYILDDAKHKKSIDEFQTNHSEKIEFPGLMADSDDQQRVQNLLQTFLDEVSFTISENIPQTMNIFSSVSTIDNAILPKTILSDRNQLNQNVLIPNTIEVTSNQSITAAPVIYTLSDNTNQTDDLLKKSAKFEIKCQPRKRFRPRTQNESKSSSHYLRCEPEAEHDHPTTYIPQDWTQQSDTNIIEVALMDINGQPHPYILANKNQAASFDDKALIIKLQMPNTLYFRLTNEDFIRGYKIYMIEFIKSKQDETITKDIIRKRNLDQSMLRFMRIYRDAQGHYQRDLNSETYSCVMKESYGDIAIESMSPQFGPMHGQEMVFVLIKGRFTKKDISITVTEPTHNWNANINKFLVNGGFVYFSMPKFPYPKMIRANANVNIFFKQEKIYEGIYLYTSLLDQELSTCNFNNSISSNTNQINQIQFDMLTMESSPRKSTKMKTTKRLDRK